jgi:hypothetical protein
MAKDIYHETVKKALEKDRWVITNEFFRFSALLDSSMNDDFFSLTQRRKGAKFRCLFL